MEATFTDYLDEVRAKRAELRDSVAAVEEALAAPVARGGAWRERVRAALAELQHDLRDHVELTEAEDGLHDRIREAAPRLSTPIERLAREHHELAEKVSGYLAVLEHGGTTADLPAFREEVTALCGRLVRHRQRGSDLVYEAYNVDIGGSG